MLTFAIPTWNRADKLRICVGSMLEQIDSFGIPAKIVVSDNASDDKTPEILAAFKSRFPGVIEYQRLPEHVPSNDNFKAAFGMSESDWTWTFGDDDRLAPASLPRLMPMLEKGWDFLHVAEKTRASDEVSVHAGTFLELAQALGVVDLAGFISGNIVRTKLLRDAYASPRMGVYGRSSYAHVLGLLETCAERPSALINAPVVLLQDENQTDDTAKRWALEDTCMRYVAVADGLKELREMGRIPQKLPLEFFRYLQGNLFGKVMLTFWGYVQEKSEQVPEIQWERLFTLASFLEDDAMTKTVEKFKSDLDEYCLIAAQGVRVIDRLSRDIEASQPCGYPFTYV